MQIIKKKKSRAAKIAAVATAAKEKLDASHS